MTISEQSLDALSRQVGGAVLVPSSDGFEAACGGFNLADIHRPRVVVVAASAEDVAAAVRFATAEGLPVRVHATGHGLGAPARGGVLVNTSRLTAVSVDPTRRRARVAAGARWAEVIAAATPHGLAPLCGSSPTVGVVGYTLGGGLGPFSRALGVAADRVRSLRMVTAAGTIIEVDAEREPELFWALCGGKPEVGIVTEIEFDLLEIPDYYGGGLYYPGEHAAEILRAFGAWVHTLPTQSSTSIALLRLPDLPAVPAPLRGRLSVHLRFTHLGDDRDGAAALAPMRAVAEPLIDTVTRTPYAAIASVHQDPTEPLPAWDAGLGLRELPEQAIDALLAGAGPKADSPLTIVELRHLGGAAARSQGAPNAVGGRDAEFLLGLIAVYPPPLRAAVDQAGAALLDAMRPWALPHGLPANFQGADAAPDSVRRAWSPDTVERLRTITRTWNPDRRFRFGYSLEQDASG